MARAKSATVVKMAAGRGKGGDDPPGETRRQKWRRLVSHRVALAHKALANIIQLGDRDYYDFTADDVARVVQALERDVEAIKYALESGGKPPPIIKWDDEP